MGSDSLLDPKNKDVLIIMAQKEKIDPKFKATKNWLKNSKTKKAIFDVYLRWMKFTNF